VRHWPIWWTAPPCRASGYDQRRASKFIGSSAYVFLGPNQRTFNPTHTNGSGHPCIKLNQFTGQERHSTRPYAHIHPCTPTLHAQLGPACAGLCFSYGFQHHPTHVQRT
jgi:hypothetical protein